ncbi:hypothetical protein BJ166DRAFT_589041 [Pestalotiopsis sp. NC0098]|nr:hypothetical protein BJ166DRAFT_589041 [Pestalotiopsis sp. NC0098]
MAPKLETRIDAGNFGGALATGVVVSIVVVLAIGGIILCAALYWRKVAQKVAPNKFPAPEAEKPWPKPPKSLDDNSSSNESPLSSASPSPASSRANSVRKNSDPVVIKELKPITRQSTAMSIPPLKFDQPFT